MLFPSDCRGMFFMLLTPGWMAVAQFRDRWEWNESLPATTQQESWPRLCKP